MPRFYILVAVKTALARNWLRDGLRSGERRKLDPRGVNGNSEVSRAKHAPK